MNVFFQEGTINLNANNPIGCQTCFCFGQSGICSEKKWDRGQVNRKFPSFWKFKDLKIVYFLIFSMFVVISIDHCSTIRLSLNQNQTTFFADNKNDFRFVIISDGT